jgi:hypothetical protein
MKLSRSLLVNATVAVLALASAVAVVVSNGSVTTKDREGRAQNLLPVFRSQDVTGLELSAGKEAISLRRTQASDAGLAAFELVSPVKELADAATVDKYLGALASAKPLRPVAEGLARDALGLVNPSARIVVTTAKLRYELDFGGAAPTPAGARYVEVKSSAEPAKLWLVGKSVVDDLTFELDAFRLRSVVSVTEADVLRVNIKSPTLDLSLARGSGRTFLVEGEPRLRADRDTVTSLFFQLGRLSANRFLGAAEAEAALGPNRARLELVTKDPANTVKFEVGGSCPGDDSELVLVRRAPGKQSACVSRELEATLGLKREAFFDEHPFALHTDEVEELALSSERGKFRLVRKGTAFVLHAQSDADVELEAGNQRITDVLSARGERVVGAQLAQLGLEPARGTVTARSSGGSEADVVTETVRVGDEDSAHNLFLYREADGVTLKIPRDEARAFNADSTLLRAKKLTEFGPSSFVSAEIIAKNGRQLLTRDANGALRLDSPKGFEPDGGLSADAIQALGSLTAERFVADHDDGSFGLNHSPLQVRFASKTNDGPKLEHDLRFGDDTALGVYATLDQNGPVFVLPRTVKDTLGTLLINRSVFSAEPASLQTFELLASGRALRFERHGDHFAPSPAGSFPEDRLPDLLEALGNLRPEAGIHTGPAEPAEGFSKPILSLRLTPLKGATQIVNFGAGDSWRATSVFYLRMIGVDATFVIAQSKVRPLLAAF